MQKKILAMLLSLCMLFSLSAYAEDAVQTSEGETAVQTGEGEDASAPKVFFDGKQLEFDVDPVIINGRTMVPIRAISEEFGAVVHWDEETETITIIKDNVINTLVLGVDTAQKREGEKVTEIKLETAPFTVESRTMVPLRYLLESFGMKVEWIEEENTVLIAVPEEEENVKDTNDAEAGNTEEQNIDANTPDPLIDDFENIEGDFNPDSIYDDDMYEEDLLEEEFFEDE